MLGDIGAASQQTLKTAIGCRGIGLHSGGKVSMTLHPAPPDAGIVFRRTDQTAEIRASWANTVETTYCTTLAKSGGASISTIEHLMAALAGTEIDNAIVELDGPEVPIMDGSCAPFVFLIECAGIVEQDAARRAIKVLKPVSVIEDGASAALFPDRGFSMSFEIDFDNPLIRRQAINLALDAATFKTELCRARTFGFLDEVDRLRRAGFARGGSLDNAVVVGRDQVLNAGGLRYRDEFVRHKLLDALGDLYLAGCPLLGRFRGVRSGHAHTRRLLAALFADGDAWCYTTMPQHLEPSGIALNEELKLAGD
jgi:UDP-3-O-[3-hydroxymyristoyl] N-acetylglucosamine deacetylase